MNDRSFVVVWLICLIALLGTALTILPLVVGIGVAIGRLL